jgi:hypothetical protein
MSSILVLSLASSAAAISTLMRVGCDGGVDFGEKVLGGPLALRFNGFSKIVNVWRAVWVFTQFPRSLETEKKKNVFFFFFFFSLFLSVP